MQSRGLCAGQIIQMTHLEEIGDSASRRTIILIEQMRNSGTE